MSTTEVPGWEEPFTEDTYYWWMEQKEKRRDRIRPRDHFECARDVRRMASLLTATRIDPDSRFDLIVQALVAHAWACGIKHVADVLRCDPAGLDALLEQIKYVESGCEVDENAKFNRIACEIVEGNFELKNACREFVD